MKYYNKNQILFIDLLDEELIETTYQSTKSNDSYIYSWIRLLIKWIPWLKKKEIEIEPTKIPDGQYEKNGKLFKKPRIFISYIDDLEYQVIYFNTNKERNLYFKRTFQDLNLISS